MLARMRPHRPSGAMIVAVVALVSAFAGPAAADEAVQIAAKFNGSKIKARSISASKLKNNTITGKQVAESKLGKVPSATKADSATSATSATNATNATNATTATTATTADNAATVGGVQVTKILAAVPIGESVRLASLNGFYLDASCVGTTASLIAGTSRNNTQVQYAHTNGANQSVGGREFNLDAGGTFDVDGGADNGSGTFTWGTVDGNAMTVVLSYDSGGTFGGFPGCAFVGSASG